MSPSTNSTAPPSAVSIPRAARRWRARASIAPDTSTAVTWWPAEANASVTLPLPAPSSRTGPPTSSATLR